jgi:hypothetical protein
VWAWQSLPRRQLALLDLARLHWLLAEPSENAERVVAERKKFQALVASDAVHDAPRFMRLPAACSRRKPM